MFAPEEFVSTLTELGITHVVWIPDTTLGQWDEASAPHRKSSWFKSVAKARRGRWQPAYISAEPNPSW